MRGGGTIAIARTGLAARIALLAALLMGCSGARSRPPVAAPAFVQAEPRIVTPTEAISETELRDRGAGALAAQNWRVAADDFATLGQAVPESSHAADDLFDLALALEGLQERSGARDAFLE